MTADQEKRMLVFLQFCRAMASGNGTWFGFQEVLKTVDDMETGYENETTRKKG